MTKGYGRKRKDFYQAHGRPKELYFRMLWRRGMKLLARKTLPEPYQAFETDYRLCPFLEPAVRSLFDLFTGVVDPRKRRSRRYPLQTLLTVVAMGTACCICVTTAPNSCCGNCGSRAIRAGTRFSRSSSAKCGRAPARRF